MYQVDLWNLGPEQAQMWEIRQAVLATQIFHKRIIPLIVSLTDEQDIGVRRFIDRLIQVSFEKLSQNRKENPVHHHFQVLENMLWILRHGLGNFDRKNINRVKAYIVLALLHDIGDAEAIAEKVKTSEIRKAIQRKKSNKEIVSLIRGAIEFRTEHMEKGRQIVERLLGEHFINEFPKSQIAEICATIQIHDNPTIAFILDEFPEFSPKNYLPVADYLFSASGFYLYNTAVLLRETDRLWMISPEGLEKDLMDDIGKGESPKSPEEQLAYNIERFREERELYNKTPGNFGEFQGDTFFRNRASFELFKEFLCHWRTFPLMKKHEKLKEIFSRYLGDN